MKMFIVVLMAGTVAINAGAAVTEKLQRGLFEEEANRNLEAAIKEYQSVIAQSDEQRKVVATALFRLGECYRKLGRTNEANAQYQRVVRDFSEQEQLVKLATDFLRPTEGIAAVGNRSEADRELNRRAVELRLESAMARREAERLRALPREDLLRAAAMTNHPTVLLLEQQLNAVDQKLVVLEGQFGNEHPEVKSANALRKTIQQQLDNALVGVVNAAAKRADALAAQLQLVQDELKKLEALSSASPTAETAPALTQAEADALAVAKSLVQNSPDLLNAPPSPGGYTPLQSAVSKGHHYVATFLLSNGADPNAGSSPPAILLAARNGNLRLVEMLLDKGADVNRATSEGKTALMAAAEQGFKSVAESLTARGADVNRQAYNQETALHLAVFKGHTALVELLLKRGARADVLSVSTQVSGMPGFGIGTDGGTPLHYAAHGGHANIAELLLAAGASVDPTNRSGQTPLHVAATWGKTNLCALLLDRGARIGAVMQDGATPLALAVANNHAPAVALLVARGADVNQPSFRSRPDAPNPIFLAVANNNVSALRSMLAAKPNLEALNRDNFTPLQVAVSANLDEAAELLLEAGANPNRLLAEEYSLLHNAVSRGRVSLVATLLKRGADANVVSRNGETPLSLALSALRRMPATSAGGTSSRPRGAAAVFPQNPSLMTSEQASQLIDARRRQLSFPVVPAPGTFSVVNPGAPPTSYQWNSANSGNAQNPTREDYEEIVELLKSHGADEFLQRRGFISVVRGPEQRTPLFQRGTNEWNRHTLIELLGVVYENGGADFPFPDFSKVTIYRIDGKTEKPIPVNAAEILAVTNDCSKDVPLEWGDNVEIPMADHPVNANWSRLYGNELWTLIHCLQRSVRFSVGGTNVAITLFYPPAALNSPSPPNFFPQPSYGTHAGRTPFFRLATVVRRDSRFLNLLRSSSDVSRVTVTRTDPKTKETKKMTFDLDAVALDGMGYSSLPPIPARQDLWLRDGDVIEVPEK